MTNLRKSYETLRKVWKINYENLRKILGILKLSTYDEVTTNLGKRKILGIT